MCAPALPLSPGTIKNYWGFLPTAISSGIFSSIHIFLSGLVPGRSDLIKAGFPRGDGCRSADRPLVAAVAGTAARLAFALNNSDFSVLPLFLLLAQTGSWPEAPR